MIVVDNGRRIALVTSSSAVFCIVSLVSSWSAAACCRPRGVSRASGTISHGQAIRRRSLAVDPLLQSLATLSGDVGEN